MGNCQMPPIRISGSRVRTILDRAGALRSHHLVRAVTAVSAGSIVTQALGLMVMPLIARIYGPEQLGIYGVFQSIVSTVGPVAALCIPMALILPKSDSDCAALIKAALSLSLMLAVIALITLVVYGNILATALNVADLGWTILLIPVFMFLTTLMQISRQLLLRESAYRAIATAGIVQSIAVQSAKVLLGLRYPVSATLVLAQTAGELVHAGYAFARNRHWKSRYLQYRHKWREILLILGNYRDFALYRAPQVLVNSAAHAAPTLLLSAIFGPRYAGYYAMSYTILAIPVALIGRAVGDVVYKQAAALDKSDAVLNLLTKSTTGMLAASLLIFPSIALLAPFVVPVVLGDEWREASFYMVLLAISQISHFATRPAVAIIPVLRLQRWLLGYEIFSATLRALALMVGALVFKDDQVAVALFALAGLLIYFGIYTKTRSVARERLPE